MSRFLIPFILLHLGLTFGLAGGLPAPRLEQDSERPEKMRITWPTFPCHLYELQEASSIDSWRTRKGYRVHADGEELAYDFFAANRRPSSRVSDLGRAH